MSANTLPGLPPVPPALLPPELWPNVDHLVTEDDTPVDSIFSEKQMRLLCEALYASWKRGGPFLAMANVGLFFGIRLPPLVPDVLVSLDVEPPNDPWPNTSRSYFCWEHGKPPELVVEIVSNKEGDELGGKLKTYATIGVAYYVVYDPEELISHDRLLAYSLHEKSYVPMKEPWFPVLGLGLKLWTGKYEGWQTEWLRWCDQKENLLLTGVESTMKANERAERLAAKLRELGVDANGES